jgi:transcription antitermination factor NusG
VSAADWYALQVRPRYEGMVAELLKHKDYETFVPVYCSRRRWSDRTKELKMPLFPGYVFCCFDPRKRSESPVISTPGVLKILGFANKPTALDANEMRWIRLAARPGASARPVPYLSEGAKIRIKDGPLAGIEGILARIKSRDVLVVSVSLLRRSIAVEIDKNSVECTDRDLLHESPFVSAHSGSPERAPGKASGCATSASLSQPTAIAEVAGK